MSPPNILDLPEEEKRRRLTMIGKTEAEYRAELAEHERQREETENAKGTLEDAPEGSYEPGKWTPENQPVFDFNPEDEEGEGQ